ncbi:MAG: sensor histidine kinase [Archangium sp.]
MSAVAIACWPKQMRVTSGEGPSHLTARGAMSGTEAQLLDLCALARHAVALLHATGHLEGTEVRLELPDEPVFARVSPRKMEQVMLHLIAGAVVARRSEGAEAQAVRLTVEPQDDFGDYGPSIHVRYAPRGEAEPPPRAPPGDAPREGLAVARELVEALGGHFAVRNHGLTGTTVTVRVELPDQGTASW